VLGVVGRLGYFVLIVVLLGGGYFAWKAFAPAADAEPSYKLAKVERGDIVQLAQANGTINPVSVINVGTQISGVVKTINADFNQIVEQGQVLAELDKRVLEAALAQSSAQLRKARAASVLAKATYERRKALVDEGAASKADVDAAAQQVEATAGDEAIAEASVKRDETNLGFAVILAPVAGVILSRDVDVGQTVASSFQTPTLFKIAPSLKNMQIDTNLSESDAGSIVEGQQAAFTVDAFAGRTFEGKVRQIRLSPTTVQNVVTYNVVVDVDNADLKLLPGMTAFVRINVGEVKNVLKVPNSALRWRPKDPAKDPAKDGGKRPDASKEKAASPSMKSGQEQQRVHVMRGKKPTRVPVSTGLTDGRFTEVSGEGLKEGDEVVTGDGPEGGQRNGGQQRSGGGPPR
jgi:HlyD family secretion protein